MTTFRHLPVAVLILLSYPTRGYAGQVILSRNAWERTLHLQLFMVPNGDTSGFHPLKRDAHSSAATPRAKTTVAWRGVEQFEFAWKGHSFTGCRETLSMGVLQQGHGLSWATNGAK